MSKQRQFDQESNFPLLTPYTTKTLTTSTTSTNTHTQTISKPTSTISISRIGSTLSKPNPSRPRIPSKKISKRPNHWTNRYKSNKTTTTTNNNTDSSNATTPARSDTSLDPIHIQKKGFKWPVAGSKDYPKQKSIETQQQFAHALMSGQGLTVSQILPGLRREGVDDYRDTVLAVASCALDLQARTHSLSELIKTKPDIKTLATWIKQDMSVTSVAVWIQRAVHGEFVVIYDTRQLGDAIVAHYSNKNSNSNSNDDTNTEENNNIISIPTPTAKEIAAFLQVCGSGTSCTLSQDEDPHIDNNNSSSNSSNSYLYNLTIVPIFGKDGIVSGGLFLRDKCERHPRTKINVPTECSTADHIIAPYVASACAIHLAQHSCHASTQTELSKDDIDRARLWVDLYRLPIDVVALSSIATQDAIDLIESAAKELTNAQHCHFFVLDKVVMGQVTCSEKELNKEKNDNECGKHSLDTSPFSVLGYKAENLFFTPQEKEKESLPWTDRLWTTCSADVDDDIRAGRGGANQDREREYNIQENDGARFVRIKGCPEKRLLYVGRRGNQNQNNDNDNNSDSDSDNDNDSIYTASSVGGNPYSIVGRASDERKTIRAHFSYPSTPITGTATGEYTHSVLATPVFIGQDENDNDDNDNENNQSQKLLGVLLVSNKNAPEDEHFHLPQFTEQDEILLEGFALLADGIFRRALRLRQRDGADKEERAEKIRRLNAAHEMEHWESSLRHAMVRLASVSTFQGLQKALYECCVPAIRCESVVLAISPKGAHITLSKGVNDLDMDQGESMEHAMLSPEHLQVHDFDRTKHYTLWSSPSAAPIASTSMGLVMASVIEEGRHVACLDAAVVSDPSHLIPLPEEVINAIYVVVDEKEEGDKVQDVQEQAQEQQQDQNKVVDDIDQETKTEKDINEDQQNNNTNDKKIPDMETILVECCCSLSVPIFINNMSTTNGESSSDETSGEPYASLCCTNLDWSWEIYKGEKEITSLSMNELKKYDFFDTLNNPPQVQALLFLQLVAEQVTTTVERILERHRLEFELSRQPTSTLGRYSSLTRTEKENQKGCAFVADADVSELETHSLLAEDDHPGRIQPPRIPVVVGDKKTASRRHFLNNDSATSSSCIDPLIHAWCPTWWEYLESCRRTLHADQLILLTQPRALSNNDIDIDMKHESFYLNVVSSTEDDNLSNTNTSQQKWYEIVAPNSNLTTSSTYVPFHTEKGTGLDAWSESVRPASAPVSSKGSSRETILRTAMGTDASGEMEGGDVLRIRVELKDLKQKEHQEHKEEEEHQEEQEEHQEHQVHQVQEREEEGKGNNATKQSLCCYRYYYKLDLAGTFPTSLAVISRVGGNRLSKEELMYYRSVIDVVAGNLRLALLTNACRNKATRLRMALSIPATLVDLDEGCDTPRDRLRLMLRKSCNVLEGCTGACLALYNPSWEQMQIVAGWPKIQTDEDEEMGTFPEYTHAGSPVLLDDKITLRASIVGRNDMVLGVLDLLNVSLKDDLVVEFIQNGITKWFSFLLEKLALENIVEEGAAAAAEKVEAGNGGGGENMASDPITVHGVSALEALERDWETLEMDNHQKKFQSRLIHMLT